MLKAKRSARFRALEVALVFLIVLGLLTGYPLKADSGVGDLFGTSQAFLLRIDPATGAGLVVGPLVYRFMNTFTYLGRQSSSIGGLQVLR